MLFERVLLTQWNLFSRHCFIFGDMKSNHPFLAIFIVSSWKPLHQECLWGCFTGWMILITYIFPTVGPLPNLVLPNKDALCFVRLSDMSEELCTFHDGYKQGIDQQIFNRKSISRKIMHPQSWKLQAKLTGEKLKGWSNSREKTNSRLQ